MNMWAMISKVSNRIETKSLTPKLVMWESKWEEKKIKWKKARKKGRKLNKYKAKTKMI